MKQVEKTIRQLSACAGLLLLSSTCMCQVQSFVIPDIDFSEVGAEVVAMGSDYYMCYRRTEVGSTYIDHRFVKLDSGGSIVDSLDIYRSGWAYTSSSLSVLASGQMLSVGIWNEGTHTAFSRVGFIWLDTDLNIVDSTSIELPRNFGRMGDVVLVNDSVIAMAVSSGDFPAIAQDNSVLVYDAATGTAADYSDPANISIARDIAYDVPQNRLFGVFTRTTSSTTTPTTQVIEVDLTNNSSILTSIPYVMPPPFINGNITSSATCLVNSSGQLVIAGRVDAAPPDVADSKMGVVILDDQYQPVHDQYVASGDTSEVPAILNSMIQTSSGQTVLVTNKSFGAYNPFGQFENRIFIYVLDDSLNITCSTSFALADYSYAWQVREADNGDVLIAGINTISGNVQTDALLIRLPVPDCSVGIDDLTDEFAISVYPSPGTSELTVASGSFFNAGARFILTDGMGRTVKSAALSGNTTTLQTSELASSIYLWRILNSNGTTLAHGKWVKR